MDHITTNNFVHYLKNELGLTHLDEDEKAVDFVVVDMLKGPLSGCDWIRFKREKLSRRLKRKLQKKLEELLANKHNLQSQ